jgi:hypothetical protein
MFVGARHGFEPAQPVKGQGNARIPFLVWMSMVALPATTAVLPEDPADRNGVVPVITGVTVKVTGVAFVIWPNWVSLSNA